MMDKEDEKELKRLHDSFIEKGYSLFYIRGVGGPSLDDVEILYKHNDKWVVAYMERGNYDPPSFSSDNLHEAIVFYEKHLSKIQHHHLAVMTRDISIFKEYESLITSKGIKSRQNHIPCYSGPNDIVYRLFVFNEGVFKIKELDKKLPYRDSKLR